jgi:hypothetical protein
VNESCQAAAMSSSEALTAAAAAVNSLPHGPDHRLGDELLELTTIFLLLKLHVSVLTLPSGLKTSL